MGDSTEKVINDIYYVWATLFRDKSLEEYLNMIFKGSELNGYKDMRIAFNKFLDEQEL